ncbi:hypothetical protein GCM10010177_75210 [Actinomadura citrea]|nr:hypothetical protein GCM10010177_75210 [Actinomadura citrea]
MPDGKEAETTPIRTPSPPRQVAVNAAAGALRSSAVATPAVTPRVPRTPATTVTMPAATLINYPKEAVR